MHFSDPINAGLIPVVAFMLSGRTWSRQRVSNRPVPGVGVLFLVVGKQTIHDPSRGSPELERNLYQARCS